MKQEIMEKLLNDEELSTSEIVYIGKNLDNTAWKDMPYDHAAADSLTACGLKEDDVNELNDLFADIMKKNKPICVSKIVEKVEKTVCSDERFMRMMIFQALQYAHEKASISSMPSGLSDIMKRFLGGDMGNKEGNDQ